MAGGAPLSPQGHDVDFVVIGGFSLAVHGVVRATKDIDIVPDPSRENLRRLGAALDELEARIDLGGLDPSELGIALDAEGLGHGGNSAGRAADDRAGERPAGRPLPPSSTTAT